jgi:hypothetical protein
MDRIQYKTLNPDNCNITDEVFSRDVDRYMKSNMPSFPLGLLSRDCEKWEIHYPEIEIEEVGGGFLAVELGETYESEEEAEEAAREHQEESTYGFPWANGWVYRPDERISTEELQDSGFVVATYEPNGQEGEEYRLCGIDGGGYDFKGAHWAKLYAIVSCNRGWTVNTKNGPKQIEMGGE